MLREVTLKVELPEDALRRAVAASQNGRANISVASAAGDVTIHNCTPPVPANDAFYLEASIGGHNYTGLRPSDGGPAHLRRFAEAGQNSDGFQGA